MRSFLIAGLILLTALPLRAQDSLPRFAFNGHRLGEARAAGEPWSKCKDLESKRSMCVREGEVLDGMRIEAAYAYRDGLLSEVHAKLDSVAFEPVLAALTKRYGEPRALRRGKGHDYAQWRFKEGRLHLTRTGTLIIAQFAAR